jgi:uncharacterized RDD family membrane protein YckC
LRASSAGAELDSALQSPEQPPSEWKREANRRLAIHRARRIDRASFQGALPGMEDAVEREQRPSTQKKSVADRVAARYAQAPTYSEMLANEARNVARAAEAAAVAAGEARDAAQAILVGLDVDAEDFEEPDAHQQYESSISPRTSPQTLNDTPHSYENSSRVRAAYLITEAAEDDDEVLDEEEPIAPVQPLPAKLLEFPRELVAARKARPRLVEGPLREEYDRDASASQLRIFEVEQETISTAPRVEPVQPEWSPIRLDASPALPVHDWISRHTEAPIPAELKDRALASGLELPLQTASLEDRLMAGLVDAALIIGGFLVFVLVFVACTVHPPVGKPALIAAGIALCAFAAIYLLLFFNFGTDTPGMRYAKIALCTFDDENPNRNAMRRRLAALLLSVIPFGLGILWAFFDDDRLGWHDRISRTYQRSYR